MFDTYLLTGMERSTPDNPGYRTQGKRENDRYFWHSSTWASHLLLSRQLMLPTHGAERFLLRPFCSEEPVPGWAGRCGFQVWTAWSPKCTSSHNCLCQVSLTDRDFVFSAVLIMSKPDLGSHCPVRRFVWASVRALHNEEGLEAQLRCEFVYSWGCSKWLLSTLMC